MSDLAIFFVGYAVGIGVIALAATVMRGPKHADIGAAFQAAKVGRDRSGS